MSGATGDADSRRLAALAMNARSVTQNGGSRDTSRAGRSSGIARERLTGWVARSRDVRSHDEAVKRQLASRSWEDSNDYAEAKSDVVDEIMRHAEAWGLPGEV